MSSALEAFGVTDDSVATVAVASAARRDPSLLRPAALLDAFSELASNRFITFLNLEDVPLQSEEVAMALGGAFSRSGGSKSVTQFVKMCRCGITHSLLQAFLRGVGDDGFISRLEILDLSENPLGDEGAATLAAYLSRHNIVGGKQAHALTNTTTSANNTTSSINNSSSGGGGGGVSGVLSQLASTSIRTLELNACRIGPVGAAAIGTMLGAAGNSRLTSLSLNRNKFRAAGTASLCEGLRHNHSLRLLSLSDNNISADGGLHLARLLRENTTIETLQVGGNYLSTCMPQIALALRQRGSCAKLLDFRLNRVDADTCFAMSQVLEGGQFYASCLSLESNPIGDRGLVALFHAIKGTSIQLLDLSNTDLTAASAPVIADMIHFCPLLNSLQLDGNALGDAAVADVCREVAVSKSITALNLERCGLGPRAMDALATAIAKQRRMRSLTLAENKIGGGGMTTAITPSASTNGSTAAAAASTNASTKSVNITANGPTAAVSYGSGGVLPVLDALCGCRSLQYLDLSDMGIGDTEDVLRALVGVLAANAGLQEVNLEHNPVARGFPQGRLTRAMARDMAADVAAFNSTNGNTTNINNNSNGVNTSPLRSKVGGADNSSHKSGGGALLTATNNNNNSGSIAANRQRHQQYLAAIYKPRWATCTGMDHRSLGAGGEDDGSDGEDGAQVPLIPHPESLHHPLLPGYGHGRFASGNLVSTLSEVVPFNVAVSHGQRVPLIPGGDQSQSLKAPPRRPMRQSPYSLAALESNPAHLPVTEDHLRKKFDELDIDGNGFLSRGEFKKLYLSFQSFGLRPSEQEVDRIMGQHSMWGDDRVSFDEFCVLMLRLAQR